MSKENNAWQKLGPGVLSVDFINEEQQGSIYISDNEDFRNKLTVKIKNVGHQGVTLNKSEEGHIELFFPKGLLDPEALPEPSDFKISEWSGVSGADLFNLGAMGDEPVIDFDKLNESTKIDVSGLVDNINSTQLEPTEAAATRGLKSRNVTNESDLTKMVKESNEIKKQALQDLKELAANQQVMRSPVMQQGMARFADLFVKITDLSSQVDKSIEELFDLQKRVEQGREHGKEEIFNYIQEELANGITTYLEGLEGEGLFGQGENMTMKDLLKGFDGIQLSDEITSKMSKEKDAVEWSIEIIAEEEGVTIRLTKNGDEPMELGAGDYMNIEIINLKAINEGGTRNSGVEVRYPSIVITSQEDDAQLNRFSQVQLSVVNRRGQKFAPLQLSIVEGQMILNDGTTPNRVVLRMINNGQDPIYLKKAELEITYEVQQEGEDESYALTDKDDSLVIQLENSKKEPLTNANNNSKGANKFVNEVKAGQNPKYEFVVAENQNFELKSGDYWLITLDNLKTGIDAGFANIRFNYRNVPEYWDGSLTVTIQRTPLIFSESNVGIGVLSPDGKIHIKGDDNLINLEGKDESYITYRKGKDTVAKVGFDHAVTTDFSIDNPKGNIHLKTENQVIINNQVPFQFKRLELTDEFTDTQYPSKEWNAAIVGWEMLDIDFESGSGSEVLRMEKGENGNWHVHSQRKVGDEFDIQLVTVDVMFVSKMISTSYNWR
jgi:hypothetical protein